MRVRLTHSPQDVGEMHAHWPPLHTQHGRKLAKTGNEHACVGGAGEAMAGGAAECSTKGWLRVHYSGPPAPAAGCQRRRQNGVHPWPAPPSQDVVLCPPPAMSSTHAPYHSPGWCGIEGALLTAGTWDALAARLRHDTKQHGIISEYSVMA